MIEPHICNLKYFSDAYKRTAVVALDSKIEDKFTQLAPEVPVVTLHIPEVPPEKRY